MQLEIEPAAAPAISKPLRKKLQNVLVATFVLDIAMLLIFIGDCVWKYMSMPFDTIDTLQLTMSAVFDAAFLFCLLFYLFAVKMKLLVMLGLTWFLAVVSLIARIIIVLRSDIGIQHTRIADYVTLACCVLEIALLVFTTCIWKKVPDRKWLKRFDMTQRMTIVQKPKKGSQKQMVETKHKRLRRFSDEKTDEDFRPP